MSISIRLSAYLILPILFSLGSFFAMHALSTPGVEDPVLAVMLGISILLGMLPILLYRLFVHAQIRQGFAHMDDGSVLLPHELGIAAIVGDKIRHWQAFEQVLDTTVKLHGAKSDLVVGIRIALTLCPDNHGKELAKHFDEALPLLERAIQDCLYGASRLDEGFALALDGSTLLNEDDERVLKSKFLSALEMLAIKGVYFPHDAAGIRIDRNVRKEKHAADLSSPTEELREEDLQLDGELLQRAGIA